MLKKVNDRYLPENSVTQALEAGRQIGDEDQGELLLSSFIPNVHKMFDSFTYDFWCELIHSIESWSLYPHAANRTSCSKRTEKDAKRIIRSKLLNYRSKNSTDNKSVKIHALCIILET